MTRPENHGLSDEQIASTDALVAEAKAEADAMPPGREAMVRAAIREMSSGATDASDGPDAETAQALLRLKHLTGKPSAREAVEVAAGWKARAEHDRAAAATVEASARDAAVKLERLSAANKELEGKLAARDQTIANHVRENAKLGAQMIMLEAQHAGAELEALVDAAVDAGTLPPAKRSAKLEAGRQLGVDWLRADLADLRPLVVMRTPGPGGGPPARGWDAWPAGSEAGKRAEAARTAGLTPDDFRQVEREREAERKAKEAKASP